MKATLAPELVREFAPRGRLRAAINLGNGVLVQKKPATGGLEGVTPALARELARRLGVELDLIEYAEAGKVADAAGLDAWDVCFLAIDPVRAAEIDFTAAYVVIEGTYMVREELPLKEIADVDRKDVSIAVSEKSGYDLYLTRTIKKATLVRVQGTTGAFDVFVRDGHEAIAGVRQPLVKLAATYSGYRVMPGRFTDIRQAMGMPKGRTSAAQYLKGFVEEMKASGFVARALAESGQADAQVAPPEGAPNISA